MATLLRLSPSPQAVKSEGVETRRGVIRRGGGEGGAVVMLSVSGCKVENDTVNRHTRVLAAAATSAAVVTLTNGIFGGT